MNMNKEIKEVNCNDLIRIEVTVNGVIYYISESTCNTQNEFLRFVSKTKSILLGFKLVDLSRMQRP